MHYKSSKYLFFSKSLFSDGQTLIYSTKNSKLIKVHTLLAQYLQDQNINKIPDSNKEYFFKNGFLVDEKENELHNIILENRKKNENKKTLFEVIQPSAWCQLGCHYCGQTHEKKGMNDYVISNITERIAQKIKTYNYRLLSIGWFGGEPLTGMAVMRKINAQIKDKCENIEIKNSKIVTNGLSLKLNIFKELVEEFNINTFEITLDGLGEYHDQNRPLKNTAQSSFKIIYHNLLQIFNSNFFNPAKHKIIIRCNVNKDNYHQAEALIEKFYDDGAHQKISSLYFVSIYSWAQNDAHNNSLTKEEFAYYKIKWDILKAKLGYNMGASLTRKYNTCVTTDPHSDVYDTYGNVYNCTEVSLTNVYQNTKYKLGNLSSKNISKERHLSDWYERILENKHYQCHSCKLFPICGGACPKSWEERLPPCPPYRNNIRSEIQLFEVFNSSQNNNELAKNLQMFEQTININQMKYE